MIFLLCSKIAATKKHIDDKNQSLKDKMDGLLSLLPGRINLMF